MATVLIIVSGALIDDKNFASMEDNYRFMMESNGLTAKIHHGSKTHPTVVITLSGSFKMNQDSNNNLRPHPTKVVHTV